MNRGQRGNSPRKLKPCWDRKWLFQSYTIDKKSALEIAKENECTENNILFWLKKHKIKTRNVSEVRKVKHWGSSGSKNPMYGKIGKENPNWNGGHSPERQSLYARSAWKELAKTILKGDKYTCRNCRTEHKQGNKLVVHHIKQWSMYPELRFDVDNLITLCENCHKEKHRGGEPSPNGDKRNIQQVLLRNE